MQFWKALTQSLFRTFFIMADEGTQLVYRLSKGALGHRQAGFNILLLTTTGRKTGLKRTHALLYLKEGNNWIIVGSNGGNSKHPAWYFNLLDQPQATIQVGRNRHAVRARTVFENERKELWERMLKIWPAYGSYQAGIQREIPILVLQPVRETVQSSGKLVSILSTGKPVGLIANSSFFARPKDQLFISIHWKRFWRDLAVINFGFTLFGFAIACMIRSNLGTGAWAVLEVALAQILHLTPGTLSVIVGFTVLLVAVLMKEKIGWGTIANIVFIGPWEDFFLWLIPSVRNNLPVQVGLLFASILVMGMASAIYIGVDAGAGPRDSLMLAVKRTTGLSIRMARFCIEILVVLVGWILKGPLGIGTVIVAILIGPAVQWGFKIFNVQPHKNLETSPLENPVSLDG